MANSRYRPAAWFRDSVKREQALVAKDDYIGARLEYQRRESDREYLKDSIKLLRRFATGYEAKNGYALRDVIHLTGARLAKVKKLAAQIREEQASDHVEVAGRTKARIDALARYTGQKQKGRKRFIVHTPHPETTKVKLIRQKGKRPPVVEVQEKVKGGTLAGRFFLLSDYSKREPTTFKQISRIAAKMVKAMPKGYYVIVTSNHGNIGVPIERDRLLHVLESNYHAYDILGKFKKDDRGLAEVITGFKLVSFTVEGAQREYKTRLTRRQALRLARQRVRAEKQRRIRKRLR